MSQNDFNIANQGFPSFRSDLNSALQALVSNSSGETSPATTYAYQWWYDTANDTLKLRNADNDAWIDFATFDQAADSWSFTSLDINGGTIDGTVIGGSTPAAGTFTALTSNGIDDNASATAMTLDASGNVGIGVSPSVPLHVNGRVRVDGGSNDLDIYHNGSVAYLETTGGSATPLGFATNGVERMRIDASGNLLVGTTITPGNSGSVGLREGGTGQLILLANSGGLYHQVLSSYYTVTTAGGSTSDATLKKNVTQLTGSLEKVCAMRGVNFEFNSAQKSDPDNGVQVGVIAQEVEAQYPGVVVTNSEGIKSVRYDRLVAPLIEAIKEQKSIIDALEARIAALEANTTPKADNNV